ncbi:histone family protein [[Eubacterium] cellulosolvens]
MNEGEISNAAIHRLIQKAGAARIGDDAIEELRTILEELAVKIGRESWELSTHAGRKTVKADDVKLASKRILKEF